MRAEPTLGDLAPPYARQRVYASVDSPAHNVLIARGKRSGGGPACLALICLTPRSSSRAGGNVLLKAEDRIIGTLSGLAPEDPHGADLTDFRMVVWHRASARQRLVTDGEAM